MSHDPEHKAPHGRRRPRPWAAPLVPRSPDEPHRASTPLELLFDLVIVVAVAQAASGLHHALAAGHFGEGVIAYSMTFFGVWWAWVNFSWFASAYDNDDVGYRLLVLVQLTGALLFAAGIPSFEHGHPAVGISGYVLMRLSLVTLWLRASRADPIRRACALRYTGGVLLVQAAWLTLIFAPREIYFVAFWAFALCELAVPAWAERATPTPWHPEHIAERYGLFTLITLGESILAASVALRSATAEGASVFALLPVIVGGLLIVFAFFWLYFERPGHEHLRSYSAAFLWGYGHYFIFAAAAAVGAGLAVSVDQATGHAQISRLAAGATVAVPVALLLLCLGLLHARGETTRWRAVWLAVTAGVLAGPFTGQPVLVVGILLAGLVAYEVVTATRARGLQPLAQD